MVSEKIKSWMAEQPYVLRYCSDGDMIQVIACDDNYHAERSREFTAQVTLYVSDDTDEVIGFSINGITKRLMTYRQDAEREAYPCPDCGGSGQDSGMGEACARCGGAGKLTKTEYEDAERE